MARQGGWVQLEQSDMRLALNMAKMAKEGFSRAAMEKPEYRIIKPRAEAQEEKNRGVEFPGHTQVKATIQRHPVMLRQNQTSGCLPCQTGTAKYLQTRWRRKRSGAPPSAWRREWTRELTPSRRGMPPTPTSNTSGAEPSEIVNLPTSYTYSHTALPCAECFDDNEDTQHHTNFQPDMLTDES